MSKKVLLPLGGIATLLSLGWWFGRNKEQPQLATTTEPSQPKKEQKPQPQPKQPTSSQPKSQQTQTTPDYLKALSNLSSLSQLLALEYDATKQSYENAILEYTQRLEKLVPAMSVFAMKTPLSALTSEDLPLKVLDMFKYKSYSYAIENFPKLMQGYYIAKANGLTTDNLTDDDLIAIADNPALAVNINENYLNIINNLAEVLKLNIKTNLDMIGKLKDEYKIKLDALKRQADMIKTMVQLIQKEKELELKREKVAIDWYKAHTQRIRALRSGEKQETTIPQIEVAQ